MNHFLTNKAKSIPKLIVINKATSRCIAHWGPRPNGGRTYIKHIKKHGVIDETIKAIYNCGICTTKDYLRNRSRYDVRSDQIADE
jgi:hypothetical protein